MGRISLDTTLLIDLQKEREKDNAGPAHDILKQHNDAEILVSAIVLGEFRAGFKDPGDPTLHAIERLCTVMPVDTAIAWRYRMIFRLLKSQGKMIKSNDLWICSTSLQNKLPIVTADTDHFSRVPELEIIAYK